MLLSKSPPKSTSLDRVVNFSPQVSTPANTEASPSFPTTFDGLLYEGTRNGNGWAALSGCRKRVAVELKSAGASNMNGLSANVQAALERAVAYMTDVFGVAKPPRRLFLSRVTYASAQHVLFMDDISYFTAYRLAHAAGGDDLLVSPLHPVARDLKDPAPSLAEMTLAMLYDLDVDGVLDAARNTVVKGAQVQPLSPITGSSSEEGLSGSADVASSFDGGKASQERRFYGSQMSIVDERGRPLLTSRFELIKDYTMTKPDIIQPRTSTHPPVTLNLVLTRLLHGSKRIYVYGASGFPGHDEVAVKIVRGARRPEIEREMGLLSGPLKSVSRLVIPLLAVFAAPEERMEGELDYFVEVFECGGESPLHWADLPEEKRWHLSLSLTQIHQNIGVEHDDAAPDNVVVPSDGNPPRWIDWGLSRTEHHCRGVKKCRELTQRAAAMGLAADQAVLRATVENEGLRY